MTDKEKELMLSTARCWVGYLEKQERDYSAYEKKTSLSGLNNWTRFGRLADLIIFGRDKRNKDGYAWCCMFVLACLYESKAGHQDCSTPNELFLNNAAQAWICKELNGGHPLTYFAGCQAWLNAYKSQGKTSDTPHAGDFVLYLDAVGKPYHIGIVEAVNGDGTFTTIEGNTSATGSNVEPNGGAVARKTRRVKNVVFLCN